MHKRDKNLRYAIRVKVKDNRLESSKETPTWDVLVLCFCSFWVCSSPAFYRTASALGSILCLLSIRESTIGESAMISVHVLAGT
jgi:hypothetical protein